MKSFLKKLLVIPAVIIGLYGVLVVVDKLLSRENDQTPDEGFSFSLSTESDEAARADIQKLVESFRPSNGVNLFGNNNAIDELSQQIADSAQSASRQNSVREEFSNSFDVGGLGLLGIGAGRSSTQTLEDVFVSYYTSAQLGDGGHIEQKIRSLESQIRQLQSIDTPESMRSVVDDSVDIANTTIAYLTEIKNAPKGASFDDILASQSIQELELRSQGLALDIVKQIKLQSEQ